MTFSRLISFGCVVAGLCIYIVISSDNVTSSGQVKAGGNGGSESNRKIRGVKGWMRNRSIGSLISIHMILLNEKTESSAPVRMGENSGRESNRKIRVVKDWRSTGRLANLIPNSSFEVGMTDWNVLANNAESIVQVVKDKDRPHGIYALEVQLPKNHERTSTVRLAGRWIQADHKAGDYVLSFWARSDHGGEQFRLSVVNAVDHKLLKESKIRTWALSKTFRLGRGWQRYAVRGKLEPAYLQSYRPIIHIRGNGARVFIDAVCLRPLELDASYSPRENVAMGMGTQDPFNIFVVGDTIRPFMSLYSEGVECRPTGLAMKIQNSNGTIPYDKAWQIAWQSSGHARVEAELYGLPVGLYVVQARAYGGTCRLQRRFKFAVVTSHLKDPPDQFSPFGFHGAGLVPESARYLKLIGAKAVRLVHFPSWQKIEEMQGRPVWSKPAILEEAVKAGLVVLGNPSYAPEWARRKPSRRFNYRWTRIPPKDFRLFANFCGESVRHFGQVIKLWEVWNEPDGSTYWDGTPEEYTELLRLSYRKIKSVDSQAQILGLSLSNFGRKSWSWMERALSAGLLKHQDLLAIHGYRRAIPEFTWEKDLSRLRSTMERYGGAVAPIAITEFGYQGADPIDNTTPYFPRPRPGSGSERRQAALMVRTYVITLANGVRSLFWYKWDEHRSQNIGPDIHGLNKVYPIPQPKAGLVAYNTMAMCLKGATNGKRFHAKGDQIYVYRFDRKGQPVWVAWTISDKPKDFSLPVGDMEFVSLRKMMGSAETKRVHKGVVSVTLSKEPVFVFSNLTE